MNLSEEKVVYIATKDENVKIPMKATSGSAGVDLHANIELDLLLNSGDLVKIPTGISIALPDANFVALIFARSGLAVNYGITLSNGVGVVDSDYRGEIMVGLCNLSKNPYTIKPHERIAQLIIMPVSNLNFLKVPSLDKTQRGTNGFGSTGK